MARANLELKLKCDRFGQTVVAHQYTAYPWRLSGIFRLDTADSARAYLYLTNTSPGLLAGDNLNLSLRLEAETSLYLTDQAATKVHAMPLANTKATTDLEIEVAANASLEFVPEPLILFADAALEQTSCIRLHPNAELFWSEIVLPGRLARGEYYQFRHYFSRLEITSVTGKLWFRDNIHLEGKNNPFKNSNLFVTKPVLGNFVIVQPQADLELLGKDLEDAAAANCNDAIVASSLLPDNKGLLVRVMVSKTPEIKKYLQYALNCFRACGDRSSLPYIPK